MKPATVSSITVSELSVSTHLSETNLRIIKCLLQSGARTEISEIAKELDLYEKTITKRLNRMKEDHLLELYLQCNPAAMIGYIQFAIPIIVLKSQYRSVNERMFLEYQENILYSPSILDSNNWLIFVLFGENLFKVDRLWLKLNFLK